MAVLVTVVGCAVITGGIAHAEPPKLVVLVAVDQMRADYVDWYGGAWKGGLHRLFTEGAHFRNARYPYLDTVTCAGHATLGTGSYPHTHGMVLNAWYDRRAREVVPCTHDPASPLIAHGASRKIDASGESARNLMAPTLGDEMQAQLAGSRVVGLSMKARSAIHISGRKADVALWFESGTWVTSAWFSKTPVAWIERFVAQNPIAAELKTPWTRLLAPAAYQNADDAAGEKPGSGWSRIFPHPLEGSRSGSSGKFASSPAADEYLARMARAALTEMALGQRAATDLLGVSFSMTDIVGHQFGPRSHEVQDVLARLDVVLGAFLDALDQTVGRDHYVLALSADHGVAEIPEQSPAFGKDAGRILESELKERVNKALGAEVADVSVVEIEGNDVYLTPGGYERLAARPGAVARVLAVLRAHPGIADAFEAAEVRDPARATEPIRHAAALSYFEGRSGDLLFLPKPGWIVGSLGTTHGSTHDYDQRVPVVFYGKGIAPAKHDRAISPADIAPTLAHLVKARMPKAEGAPLSEIVDAAAKKTAKTAKTSARRK